MYHDTIEQLFYLLFKFENLAIVFWVFVVLSWVFLHPTDDLNMTFKWYRTYTELGYSLFPQAKVKSQDN